MLKQKTTIAMQWTLRLICVAAMSFLVVRFQGDFPLRVVLGQSQDGPPVVITEVDSDATFYSTFQSHNQKVVANAYGIFMTHLQNEYCRGSEPNPRCDTDDPLCYNKELGRCLNPGWDVISTWRLLRSVDGGATFMQVYPGEHGTRSPILETDSQGNIYLAHTDYFQGKLNAYVLRFLASDIASNNFQNPTITTLTGAWGAKFAMEIDEARGQLYFFSNSNLFFRVRLSDMAILAEYQLAQSGTKGHMQYPHLYLDDYGRLYLAWTTSRTAAATAQCGNGGLYWSIHFMRSLDGGVTWTKPNGEIFTLPIVADETGQFPADEITLAGDRCQSPWLSSFLVKGDKAHFFYTAGSQHYVRYDLATAHIVSNTSPFESDNVSIANLDGICATRRSIKEIFYVSKSTDNRIAVMKSEDNGLTWRKHTLGPSSDTYSLGGSPQVTDDGYIIGSYTENPNSPHPKVKFFKVASLTEPSRKDVVFTAGQPEFSGLPEDFDEFSGAATAHSPTYVVGQSGLNHMRHYIGYSYADPSGGNKAQFLQFNNLVVGKQYTFYVQPSSMAGDGNCFYATAESGAVIFEGGCKGWLGNPINRISDAWKVVFNATAQSATIRLGNFFDASNSGDVSRYLYFDTIHSMIGDLELTGNCQTDGDEFTGAATAHSPTYVVGQSGLDHVRGYIGYSYGDPSGGNKAQFLQFNNLVVGNQYTFYVQPSSITGDGNCFYATAESGAVISEGGCKGWLGNPINRISDAWKVVFNATAPSATIRLGNFYDASNSNGVSRYICIDAIWLQSN